MVEIMYLGESSEELSGTVEMYWKQRKDFSASEKNSQMYHSVLNEKRVNLLEMPKALLFLLIMFLFFEVYKGSKP